MSYSFTLLRAQTEREILSLLDHPFLPTLYSYFETEKFYCLVMEFCSSGNLHSLRQKQPNRRFTEEAVRFYTSEVLLTLEYLHMLGIVYRDLKPENILVREEGHIMLSDFDLFLRCSFNPTPSRPQPAAETVLSSVKSLPSTAAYIPQPFSPCSFDKYQQAYIRKRKRSSKGRVNLEDWSCDKGKAKTLEETESLPLA